MALTFGTLLSSQGADAHRRNPFGRLRGNLRNVTRSVSPGQTRLRLRISDLVAPPGGLAGQPARSSTLEVPARRAWRMLARARGPSQSISATVRRRTSRTVRSAGFRVKSAGRILGRVGPSFCDAAVPGSRAVADRASGAPRACRPSAPRPIELGPRRGRSRAGTGSPSSSGPRRRRWRGARRSCSAPARLRPAAPADGPGRRPAAANSGASVGTSPRLKTASKRCFGRLRRRRHRGRARRPRGPSAAWPGSPPLPRRRPRPRARRPRAGAAPCRAGRTGRRPSPGCSSACRTARPPARRCAM